MVSARLISRLIDLSTMLLLAHLLTPADFGLVAIAMSLIFILEAALEVPVGQALLCLPQIEDRHYDTAFTIALLRGLLLCGSVCAAAGPFAAFYGDGRLVALVCLLSLAPLCRGLQNPRMSHFVKAFDFSREFVAEIAGKSGALLVGSAIALLTQSYWAIAAGTIAGPLITTATTYGMMPRRPRLTLSEWPAFLSYLGWTSASQVIMAVTWQSDRLLLGKIMPTTQLGMFTTANDVANIPILALFGPVSRPLLSAFVAVKDDPARLTRSYQSAASAVVAVGLPLLVGQSLIAGPVVHLVLGPQWGSAVPMLFWLSLSLVPSLFEVPVGPLVMALNRTDCLVTRNLFELGLKLPLVIVGALSFGFAGVIAARLVSELATVGFCLVLVRRIIGIPVIEQLLKSSRSMVAVVVMVAAVSIGEPWLTFGESPRALVATLILTIATAAVAYCAVLAGLWCLAGKPHGIEFTMTRALQHLWLRQGRRLGKVPEASKGL